MRRSRNRREPTCSVGETVPVATGFNPWTTIQAEIFSQPWKGGTFPPSGVNPTGILRRLTSERSVSSIHKAGNVLGAPGLGFFALITDAA